MGNKAKSTKVPFNEELAECIQEEITFDLTRDSNGYPTLQHLITSRVLKNENEYNKMILFPSTLTKVRNGLQGALDLLQSAGIIHYRKIGGVIDGKVNKKNLIYLTIDPNYKEASQEDFFRRVNNVKQSVASFQANVQLIHSDRFNEIGSEVKRLENKLESTLNKKGGNNEPLNPMDTTHMSNM